MKNVFSTSFASFLLLTTISCTKEDFSSPVATAPEKNKSESLITSATMVNSNGISIDITYTVIPSQIEAENYTSMNGVQTETCSEGGQNIKFFVGGWTKYPVAVPAAGTYTLHFRVASAKGGQLGFLFGSTSATTYVTIPATGGGQTWTTVSMTVTLQAGRMMMGIFGKSGEFSVNYMILPKPILPDTDGDG